MTSAPFAKLNLRRLAASTAAVMVGLLVTLHAQAQVAAPFVGTWKATWKTEKSTYEAVMSLTEAGGTWQTANYDRNNACAGREVPIKILSSTPTELKLELKFGEVVGGCPSAFVALKAAPDGTVTGTRSKYELVLVKK